MVSSGRAREEGKQEGRAGLILRILYGIPKKFGLYPEIDGEPVTIFLLQLVEVQGKICVPEVL